MADLGQDETAEPEPSDRDLTEDGTGRLGLAFNNPYLQRVYVDARILHAARCGTQRTLTSILRRQADPPGWALQGWNLCNDSMAHPALDYVPPCVFCPRKGHRPAREGVLKS